MYKRILVPVDGSSASLQGLSEALSIAKGLNATVRVLHVVDEFVAAPSLGPGLYYEESVKACREGGKLTLSEAAAFAHARGAEPETLLIDTIGRRAADVITEQAKEWGAELIVMGTHGRRGVRRLVLGSDAELVVRQSPVPVLLVRERPAAT
jgi:nucleotide-binding universal stress UspA family protein